LHVSGYTTPADLWRRYQSGQCLASPIGERPLAPFNHSAGKDERYYQQTAINRTVEAILKGDNRLLLTTAHLESCIEPAKVPKPVGQHPG
jgi:type I restriction enzyme R subunit